jgi:hypothetical protein
MKDPFKRKNHLKDYIKRIHDYGVEQAWVFHRITHFRALVDDVLVQFALI